MDKINLSTIGILPQPTVETVQIGAAAVSVTSRIPYESVLEMIQWCINFIVNDRPFVSAPLHKIIKDFALLKYYTNLNMEFLEQFSQVEQVYESYDIVDAHNIIALIIPHIDAKQLQFFETTLADTLESIVAYRNSAKGIVDAISEDADANAAAIQSALAAIGGDEEESKQVANILKFAEMTN